MELVSHPCSINFHRKKLPWGEIVRKALEQFVKESVNKLNYEFNEAYEYYRKLSNEYYIIGFGMNIKKLLSDPIMFFDATSSFKDEVSLTVDKLAKSTGKILKFMNDELTKEMLKELFKEVKINLSMPGTIKKELHETIKKYIDDTKKVVLKEVNNVESKLCKIEVKI